jgi:hypothetical protein
LAALLIWSDSGKRNGYDPEQIHPPLMAAGNRNTDGKTAEAIV